MRQQQFIFATKADDLYVLGMRLLQTFVRYISQCLCSPHSLQRLAVCYLVLGWLFKRAWMMFQRRQFIIIYVIIFGHIHWLLCTLVSYIRC